MKNHLESFIFKKNITMELKPKLLFRWLIRPDKANRLYWVEYLEHRGKIIDSKRSIEIPGDLTGRTVIRLVALRGENSPFWDSHFRIGYIEGDTCYLYLQLFNNIVNILPGKTEKNFFAVDPDGKVLRLKRCYDLEKGQKNAKIDIVTT